MYYQLAKFFLSILDYTNKKKILKYLRKIIGKKFNILLDVGAHYGESIKLFNKNFKINEVLAFEPSDENFKVLKKNTININNVKIHNFALGEKTGYFDFKQHYDSESSTLSEINIKSRYYQKKNNLLNFFGEKKLVKTKVNVKRLDEIMIKQDFKIIDVLKIDTEGNDYYVIKGLGNIIQNVKILYFEHHFHDMLKKNYTLSDIHYYLSKNNFKKVFKNKMFFRKTFEYIYINNALINE